MQNVVSDQFSLIEIFFLISIIYYFNPIKFKKKIAIEESKLFVKKQTL